jgi:2-aminoadipate transaminase
LSYCYPEPDAIREGVRRLARVIEAELELHSTFHTVDTGTFRAVRPNQESGRIVGPANSNSYEDGR